MQSKIKTIIQSAWPVFFMLLVLNTPSASAADNNETLKGIVTLGTGGYGLKLGDGTLVRFMGSGGNKVFAACHNGDYCEISGLVLHSVKPPLFATISKVRKLKGTPPKQTGAKNPNNENTAPSQSDAEDTQNSSPFLLDDSVPEQKSAEPSAKQPDATKPNTEHAKPASTGTPETHSEAPATSSDKQTAPESSTTMPDKNAPPQPGTELPRPAEPDSSVTPDPTPDALHDKQNSSNPDTTTPAQTDASRQTETTSPAKSESGDTQNDSPFLLQDPPKNDQ